VESELDLTKRQPNAVADKRRRIGSDNYDTSTNHYVAANNGSHHNNRANTDNDNSTGDYNNSTGDYYNRGSSNHKHHDCPDNYIDSRTDYDVYDNNDSGFNNDNDAVARTSS
jgi:hypothetical protein